MQTFALGASGKNKNENEELLSETFVSDLSSDQERGSLGRVNVKAATP